MSNDKKTEPPGKTPEPPPKPRHVPRAAPGGVPGPQAAPRMPSKQQWAEKVVEQQKQSPAPAIKKDVLRQDRGTLSKDFNRKA